MSDRDCLGFNGVGVRYREALSYQALQMERYGLPDELFYLGSGLAGHAEAGQRWDVRAPACRPRSIMTVQVAMG